MSRRILTFEEAIALGSSSGQTLVEAIVFGSMASIVMVFLSVLLTTGHEQTVDTTQKQDFNRHSTELLSLLHRDLRNVLISESRIGIQVTEKADGVPARLRMTLDTLEGPRDVTYQFSPDSGFVSRNNVTLATYRYQSVDFLNSAREGILRVNLTTLAGQRASTGMAIPSS